MSSSIRTGVVAFLDSLGTKGTWLKEGPEAALRRRKENLEKTKEKLNERAFELFQLTSTFTIASSGVLPSSEVTGRFITESLGSPEGGGPVPVASVIRPYGPNQWIQAAWTTPEKPVGVQSRFLAFSDTIIALRWGEADEARLLVEFCKDLIDVFNQSLSEQILYRGVVAFGQFLYSEPILLGPAVDEAGSWFELADWMGVSLTPGASFKLKARSNEATENSKVFIEYQLPLGASSESNTSRGEFTVLAWPRFFDGGRARLLDLFSQQVIDSKISSKYENTLKFFDYVMAKGLP